MAASSLHMRELNRAILIKHLHMHVCLRSYMNVQRYISIKETVLVLSISSISHSIFF